MVTPFLRTPGLTMESLWLPNKCPLFKLFRMIVQNDIPVPLNNTMEAGSRTNKESSYKEVEGPPQSCSIVQVAADSSSLTLSVRCFDG
jgi:hypothetical protein